MVITELNAVTTFKNISERQLTLTVQQDPSCYIDSRSAGQRIPRHSWDLNVSLQFDVVCTVHHLIVCL